MTDDNVPIRADVPLDLHPDVLSPFAAALDRDGHGGRGALAAGKEALSACYSFYSAVQDAERELQKLSPAARRRQHPDGRSEYLGDLRMMTGGGLRTFHGHEEEFATAAEKAFFRAAAVSDRRMVELRGHRETVTKRIDAALDFPGRLQPALVAQAAEIRAHVKSMTDPERTKFIDAAIRANDKQTLSALLTAPPYLSGTTQAALSEIRRLAAEHWAKEESDALAAIETIVNRVMDANTVMLQRHVRAQQFGKESPQARATKAVAKLASA